MAEKADYIRGWLLHNFIDMRPSRGPIQKHSVNFGLNDWAGERVSEEEIEQALRGLEEEGILDGYHDPHASSRYFCHEVIFEELREEIQDPSTILHRCRMLGEDWVFEILDNMFEPPNIMKEDGHAEDDVWEPLPLERESGAYQEAVSTVEEAVIAIAGNNGYAETEPEERDRVVWSLQTGLAQIKEGLPSSVQVREMLIKPLTYIGEKFAGASIGEIAKAAAKALWTWILN